MQNKERGDLGGLIILIVAVGAILAVTYFFKSERSFWDTINYKTFLRVPCGLTVQHPQEEGKKVSFPLVVDGYMNGCGWDVSGKRAGTVQVFDSNGTPVTAPTTLVVPPESIEAPFSFAATLIVSKPPSTMDGMILITGTNGLFRSIPVSF